VAARSTATTASTGATTTPVGVAVPIRGAVGRMATTARSAADHLAAVVVDHSEVAAVAAMLVEAVVLPAADTKRISTKGTTNNFTV